MRVLVTGANGFIGQVFVGAAQAEGWVVRCAQRYDSPPLEGCERVVVGEISDTTDWDAALVTCDAVVHLAARVHIMNDRHTDSAKLFHDINTRATVHLTQKAAEAGVKHFLFLSTIKVLGEGKDEAYTSSDVPTPEDPYATSKAEAEVALREIAATTGMAVTILRPPLVYGENVRANFLFLMKAVARGIPLPLGQTGNKRSLIYVENLASAMIACLKCESARNRTFLISDGPAVSTSHLIRAIGEALGRSARLFPVPVSLMRLAAKPLGRDQQIDRLFGSLHVDMSAFQEATNWNPPLTMQEGLTKTAAWFKKSLS